MVLARRRLGLYTREQKYFRQLMKMQEDEVASPTTPSTSSTSLSSSQLTPAEQVSVRERMQRFNRMANETDMPARPSATNTPPIKKRADKVTVSDENIYYHFARAIFSSRLHSYIWLFFSLARICFFFPLSLF